MEAQQIIQVAEGLIGQHSQLMVKNLELGSEVPSLNEDEQAVILKAFLAELPSMYQRIILKARNDKYAKEKSRLYWEHVKRMTDPPASIDDFKREIWRRGHDMAEREGWIEPFSVDDNNKKIYNALAHYFMGVETELNGRRLNPQKGLLVFGNVGCGKTVAMRLFERNPLQCYSFVSCRRVENAYDRDGAEAIGEYSGVSIVTNKTHNYGQEVSGYAFDDLGTETDAKHFGKGLNVMEAIILNRYDNTALRGPFTHITTNLSVEEIEERYGKRAFDRFRQMFNLVDFPSGATSRRK